MKTLLAAALALVLMAGLDAGAGNNNYGNPTGPAGATPAAIATAAATATAAGGQGEGARFEDRLQIPATPPAIAPSQSPSQCPVLTPKAEAVSVLVFSHSATQGSTFDPICYALWRKQYDVADRLACKRSSAYAEANPKVCAASQ